MGLSSTGIGSGINVEQVVSQLVALEKKPLATLQTKASSVNTQISTYARIKSLMSTFADAATKLGKAETWGAKTATVSAGSGLTATATGAAQASSYDISVSQLARAQSVASSAVPKDARPGEGTLHLQLGSWSASGATFTEGPESAVAISVSDTDTLSDIASKINGAKMGVSASVLRDASGERLLLRSSATGEAAGFRVQTSDAALASLAFDPELQPGSGMAANAVQYGQNAEAKINGIAVTSATNTFSDVLPGVSFTASQVVDTPAVLTVGVDTDALKKSVQAFVDAYNALNDVLSSSTKYDAETKAAGTLQGDGTTVGLQNSVRALIASTTDALGGGLSLSSLGMDIKKGGKLSVDDAKLAKALADPEAARKVFMGSDGQAGLSARIKSFTTPALGFEGLLDNKTSALNATLKRNKEDQDRVNDRAERVEKQLRARYEALDTKMASLSALNAYIGQQVTQWNRNY